MHIDIYLVVHFHTLFMLIPFNIDNLIHYVNYFIYNACAMCYIGDMNNEYEVGTHFDLSHINKRSSAPMVQKKSSEPEEHDYEVGTAFVNVARFIKNTHEKVKMELRIPVVLA